MKIDFAKNQDGYQQAEKLRLILTDYYNSNSSPEARAIIEDLRQQIDSFLSSRDKDDSGSTFSIFNYLSSFWDFLSGPSQRELELSKQRRELIERAEHAETSAFQALAESSEIKRDYDQAQKKIRELEQELAKIRPHS